MAESIERWKLDPDMPRLFLIMLSDDHEKPVWANPYRTSFEITKHLDSKMEEARLRGLVLRVVMDFVDPTEVYGEPEPEKQLSELEKQAPEQS